MRKETKAGLAALCALAAGAGPGPQAAEVREPQPSARAAPSAPRPGQARVAAAEPERLEVAERDRRGEDQTLLTFPEWFLVFSPEEMARALESGAPPSSLPWMAHVGQFWSSYWAANREIRARGYGFNGGYHAMVMVIGVSTTVEYALRGLYESTMGRAFEFLFGHATPEDRLEAAEARRYVDFIEGRPWYEFDFVAGVEKLWSSLPGESGWRAAPRRYERKVKLTAEWGAKAVYGWALGKAAAGAYEKPIFTSVSAVRGVDGSAALRELPRYQPFTKTAVELSASGADFVSVAGNSGVILVSILAPGAVEEPALGQRRLFEQSLPTRPGTRRLALLVTVGNLAELLRWAARSGAQVEHVFDY